MRILFDMDGVAAALLEEWLRRYNIQWQDNMTHADIKSWGVHEWVKPECGRRVFEILHQSDLFDSLRPHDGAIEFITKTAERGHDCLFATAAPGPEAARGKMSWAMRHFAHLGWGPEHVIFTHRKDWIRADVLVDDKPDTVRAWAENPHDAVIISISHPYNQEIAEVADFFAQSWEDMYNAWKSIYEEICRLEETRSSSR